MINQSESIIAKTNNLFLEAINTLAKNTKEPFEENILKKLGAENKPSFFNLISCFDIIEDTESAKVNFEKFGLDGIVKIGVDGEQYLRLYGILNAVYLQKNAIIEIIEILKLHNKKEVEKLFNQLQITSLRNILGSHTSNFFDFNTNLKSTYQFSRGKLNIERITTLDSFGKFKENNLLESFSEFNLFITEKYIDILEIFLERISKLVSPKFTEKAYAKIDVYKNNLKGGFDYYIDHPDSKFTKVGFSTPKEKNSDLEL